MISVLINVIKHHQQRYDTIGDWQIFKFPAGDRYDIRVSNLGDSKMNACIVVHELIEALLCRFNDPEITDKMVDEFDMSHEDLEEPGDSPEAPYHEQHKFASEIEKVFAKRLEVNWDEYERRISEIS
jgi:hypothetical protein